MTKLPKPYMAGILNIIPGAGYIYIDKRRLFGWLILASVLLSVAPAFIPGYIDGLPDDYSAADWLFAMSGLVMWVAVVYDAYRTAANTHKNKVVTKVAKAVTKVPPPIKSDLHKKGLVSAGAVMLVGIVISTVLWINFYYALASLMLFPATILSIVAYKSIAKRAPYGLQARRLLLVILAGFVGVFLAGLIPDSIRWYYETGGAGALGFEPLNILNYYIGNIFYLPTWQANIWELLQAAIVTCLGSALVIKNAFVGENVSQ